MYGADCPGFGTDEYPMDFDRLFEAYQSSLAVYCAQEQEAFPSAAVRLAIVSGMIAEAQRGESDPLRLAAAGLLAVGMAPHAGCPDSTELVLTTQAD